MRIASRPLTLFGISSLAAIACGALIGALGGVGVAGWLRNLLAWLAGLLVALGLRRVGGSPRVFLAILATAVTGIAATLAGAEQEGVRRWLDAGPLHINMAALLAPVALVAAARLGIWRPASLAGLSLCGLVLIAQPDASQATALMAAAAVLLLLQPAFLIAKVTALAACLMLAGASWLRPDPLQPVAEVELVFGLAAQTSAALVALAAAALAATCLSPAITLWNRDEDRTAALALAIYMSAVSLMPLFGAFPVPLVGVGMSFPIGFWLGVGLLTARPASAGESD